MMFLDTLGMHARKFWCLMGFVAIIFTILAIRSIYMAFFFPCFWNLLSAALMSIFAYWWVTRVLARPGRYRHTHSSTSYDYDRDIDIRD